MIALWMKIRFIPTILLLVALLSGSLAGCTPRVPPNAATVTILYTNDEHGWMEGMQTGQGAAELVGLWRADHGYRQDGSFLILSGGDNWTGPAISTWFDGRSMVEVMNAMGYRASVIGNHEFDFGLEGLKVNLANAEFPYLSANIRYKQDGSIPTDLGFKPFAVVLVGDLKAGIIGLTTTSTPFTTNPTNVAELEFIDYEQALRDIVPEVRAAGADIILVPGHICQEELTALANEIKDLKIQMLGGGHCNELFAEKSGDTVLIEGGYHYTSYAYLIFSYDPVSKQILDVQYGTRPNEAGISDPEIASVIDGWADKTDAELKQPIGYLGQEIPRQSQAMEELITETWLLGYPTADIALTNTGGMRDRIPAGIVTLADIVGVMPFNNVLVDVRLTGDQLEQVLRSGISQPAIGGMHRAGVSWVLNKTGQPLEKNRVYSVLVNDFMYAGGDKYQLLAQFDPDAYNTAIDWRQPVIDWILDQESTQDIPLDPSIKQLASD
jgi:2',3'-cyclic-nucleotide 2'-phosphodiesterase (5'-nucleotidase family)